MNFTKTSFIRWTKLLPLSRTDISSSLSPSRTTQPSTHVDGLGMLKLALVSLVAGAIFLKVAARRDLFWVVYVKELAAVALLALIGQPVNAHRLLALAFIDSLLL